MCSEAFYKFLFMVGKEIVAEAYCESAVKNFWSYRDEFYITPHFIVV